jgi:hypothetical protein
VRAEGAMMKPCTTPGSTKARKMSGTMADMSGAPAAPRWCAVRRAAPSRAAGPTGR